MRFLKGLRVWWLRRQLDRIEPDRELERRLYDLKMMNFDEGTHYCLTELAKINPNQRAIHETEDPF